MTTRRGGEDDSDDEETPIQFQVIEIVLILENSHANFYSECLYLRAFILLSYSQFISCPKKFHTYPYIKVTRSVYVCVYRRISQTTEPIW